MTRLIWCWMVMVAFLSVAESYRGDHPRFKRTRRDVNFIQRGLIAVKRPQPILDTATYEELHTPNTKQHNFGIAVVNGYNAATGVLVNVVNFPQRKIEQVGKGLTKFLDMIGGRVVGLQR